MTEFDVFVGIDWGDQSHQICILNSNGDVLDELAARHTGESIASAFDRITELAGGDCARIAVGIETPRGPLVASALERAMSVFAINPKQLDRLRDRTTVAGAKDDRRDALVLASSLRSDLALFRRVKLGSETLVAIGELVRMHEEVVQQRVVVGHRLRDQLQRYFPQVLALGRIHEERWLWELLQRAPTPRLAKSLSLKKIDSILTRHRIRRLTANEVKATLLEKPLSVAPGVTQACEMHVKLLLEQIQLLEEQRRSSSKSMKALLDELGSSDEERREHRDAQVLRSLPGVGTIVSATMLAEAWEPLERRDYRTLRTYAGVAPVTKQSGKSHRVCLRRACNKRVARAVVHWATVAIQQDPRARALYDRLRAQGKTYGRAIRGVADRLLAMLVAMLKRGELYDPNRRALA